jgi:hypothetical protein
LKHVYLHGYASLPSGRNCLLSSSNVHAIAIWQAARAQTAHFEQN